MNLTSGTSATPGGPAPHPAGLDEGFLRRVRVVSVVLTVLSTAVLFFYKGSTWGLGFGAAALWSVANLWALETLVRLALRPAQRNPVAILVATMVKLPVLYAAGALLALKGGFPPMSLLVGFSLPLAVVVLKAAGRVLAPKVSLPDREAGMHSTANHS